MQKLKFDKENEDLNQKLGQIINDFQPVDGYVDPAAEYMNKGLGKIDASHVRKELSDSGYKKMYNRIKSNYSDVAKMSSASKNINVYRNDQNRDIINLVSDNVFNKYQQIHPLSVQPPF